MEKLQCLNEMKKEKNKEFLSEFLNVLLWINFIKFWKTKISKIYKGNRDRDYLYLLYGMVNYKSVLLRHLP